MINIDHDRNYIIRNLALDSGKNSKYDPIINDIWKHMLLCDYKHELLSDNNYSLWESYSNIMLIDKIKSEMKFCLNIDHHGCALGMLGDISIMPNYSFKKLIIYLINKYNRVVFNHSFVTGYDDDFIELIRDKSF